MSVTRSDTTRAVAPGASKPCTTYCRPEEGIHAYVSSSHYVADGRPLTVEEARQHRVGSTRMSKGSECVPIGTLHVIRSIDHAEIPPTPERPIPYLVTVQVDS